MEINSHGKRVRFECDSKRAIEYDGKEDTEESTKGTGMRRHSNQEAYAKLHEIKTSLKEFGLTNERGRLAVNTINNELREMCITMYGYKEAVSSTSG